MKLESSMLCPLRAMLRRSSRARADVIVAQQLAEARRPAPPDQTRQRGSARDGAQGLVVDEPGCVREDEARFAQQRRDPIGKLAQDGAAGGVAGALAARFFDACDACDCSGGGSACRTFDIQDP